MITPTGLARSRRRCNLLIEFCSSVEVAGGRAGGRDRAGQATFDSATLANQPSFGIVSVIHFRRSAQSHAMQHLDCIDRAGNEADIMYGHANARLPGGIWRNPCSDLLLHVIRTFCCMSGGSRAYDPS